MTDYKKMDIFDTLDDDSVDIVYDNYGAEGTADKAMRTLRAGGTYLLMPHGECYSQKTQGPPCLSAHPKPGVRQVNYVTSVDFEQYALQGLDELKAMVEGGHITPTVDRTYSLSATAAAFNYSAGPGEGGVGDHIGKISISVKGGAPESPPHPCPPSGCGNCPGAPQAYCTTHCFNGCENCCA